MKDANVIKIFVNISAQNYFSACVIDQTIETFNLQLGVFLNGVAERLGLERESQTNWISEKSVKRINVSIANEDDWGHMMLIKSTQFIDELAYFLNNNEIK